MQRIMNKVGTHTKIDFLIWFLVSAIAVLAVSGNFYLAEQPVVYRFVGVLLLAVVGGVLASRTKQGQRGLQFLQDSKLEIRKMVWPSRPETMQTTMVVVAAVLAMAVLLWVIDTILFKIMQIFTG